MGFQDAQAEVVVDPAISEENHFTVLLRPFTGDGV